MRHLDGGLNQLIEQSDALAAYLQDRAFCTGDRIGLFLQNVPQFVLALIPAWKAERTNSRA